MIYTTTTSDSTINPNSWAISSPWTISSPWETIGNYYNQYYKIKNSEIKISPNANIEFTIEGETTDLKTIMDMIKEKAKPENIFDFFSIEKIDVYNDKVVKVTFVDRQSDLLIEVKAICDDNDIFDLEKGVYVCIAKLLYNGILTTQGIESAAYDIALYKKNVKYVNKAIKQYFKEIKEAELFEIQKAKEKAEKQNRENKKRLKNQKRKEKRKSDFIDLINQAKDKGVF